MKFNKTKTARKTTNLAGASAYKADNPETELVFAVLTTFLDDKHYETGDKRMERIINLAKQVSHEFLAKLSVLARKDYNMRSVTVVLLGELAKLHKGDDLVKRAICKSATRVDDLIELTSYFLGKEEALPKQVKRGIRNALLKFDRYQLSKYQAKGKDVSLVDVFNLVHPKPELATKEQAKAWKDLMNGALKAEGTIETVLSNSENVEEDFEKLVTSGKIGYMALLRNLNNMHKYKLSPEAEKLAAERLSDPEQVSKSKQLPFRFVTAFDAFKGSQILRDAIVDALEHSVGNVPVFKGKSLVALDVSGSMNGTGDRIGSIFAAALAKSNKADVITFDMQVTGKKISTRDSIMSIAKSLSFDGGGTDTGSVFRWADGRGYDRIFVISDNESWGSNAQAAYNSMKVKPKVYAIDVTGYGTFDLKHANVFHFPSWSEKVFDLIALNEDGGNIVDKVNAVDLGESRTEPHVSEYRKTVSLSKPKTKAKTVKKVAKKKK